MGEKQWIRGKIEEWTQLTWAHWPKPIRKYSRSCTIDVVLLAKETCSLTQIWEELDFMDFWLLLMKKIGAKINTVIAVRVCAVRIHGGRRLTWNTSGGVALGSSWCWWGCSHFSSDTHAQFGDTLTHIHTHTHTQPTTPSYAWYELLIKGGLLSISTASLSPWVLLHCHWFYH